MNRDDRADPPRRQAQEGCVSGPEALAAFERAAQLVKQGDHAAARAVEMLLSDRQVIEQRIAASVNVANGREE